ncbi:MAG TPA: glycosyltransferase [Actinomycetales bacterium]|nr:glycosyltransferase [Actinomycetales bacterium]
MRVAMVSEHASPLAVLGGADAGGQNVHVAALSVALAELGHEVRVYTRRDSWHLAELEPLCPGVDVVHVPVGPAGPLPKDELLPFMPAFGRWLVRNWQEDSWVPDVVHAHFWMSGVAALWARRALGVPTVQTFHALGSVKKRYQGAADTSPADRVAIETRVAGDADMVIATCSDEVRELQLMGVDTGHVTVVPCGVDTEHFTPTGQPAPEPPRRQRFRLLSLGRMVERKGVATVIEALTRVHDAELVVAGGPPAAELDSDSEARRLLQHAQRHGVADRVNLIGQVAHDDAPALIRSADVVVATPWYEPFGIVPLEAMACGRPLVGSAVGGLLDSVMDGETGVLVPPRDPQATAEAINALLADPGRRRRIGRAARARAVRSYEWSRVAEATAQAYDTVAAATRVTAEAL